MTVVPQLLCLVVLQGPAGPSPRRAVERTLEVAGHSRSYLEYVPEGATGPLPVVFVLHGEGGEARVAEEYFELNAIAEEKGFAVVYPAGIDKSWNDGRGIPPGGTRGVDDVAFVRAVLDDVAARHRVDRTRVFATGMSTGGMMCHRLADEASDMMTAVAPVSAAIPAPILEGFRLERPVSAMLLQGDSDPIIPIGGGFVYPRGIHRRGEVASLEATLGKYLEGDQIRGEPTRTTLEDAAADGTTTEVIAYPPGEGGALVVVYMVKGGGHNLPGRERDFPEWAVGKVSEDFDGARAIFDFFEACPALRGSGPGDRRD